jgi:SAM-dependent methyltransferase
MLNPTWVQLGKRWIPAGLYEKIDPFEHYIQKFTASVAERVKKNTWVLDAGAGEGRLKSYFPQARYVGIDAAVGDRNWDYSGIDVLGDLCRLPFKDDSFEEILCIVVLEHTREPGRVLEEFNRVLKAKGHIHLIVPLLWEEHQKPHDYFRFTSHGMVYLLSKAQFTVEWMAPIGGFFWVLARRLMNVLTYCQKGWRIVLFLLLAPFLGVIVPILCYYLDGIDKEKNYTLGYAVTAAKE